MRKQKKGSWYSVTLLLVLVTSLCLTSGGCETNSYDPNSPYGWGYEMGYDSGRRSRNDGLSCPGRDNATFLLTSLRRVHSQNPVAKLEPGTDEYGNFIRGYEQGAMDGYR